MRGSRQNALRKLTPLITAAFLVSLLLVVGCGRKKPGAEAASANGETAATPVGVILASRSSIAESIEVTGTVEALSEVSIASSSYDTITYLAGDEGDSVSAGQVLVRMDTSDLDASIAQASAQAEGARVALAQAKEGHVYQDVSLQNSIEAAQTTLRTAQVRLQQAVSTADLTGRSVEDGIKAAETQVAQAESGVKVAEASVETARSALTQVDSTTAASIDLAKAAVASAQASYDDIANGARSQERAQAQEAVSQARLAMENAQRDLQRLQAVRDAGAASQQSVDAAKLQYDIAASQYQQAQQSLSLIHEGATPEQLSMARQQIEQARANLAVAESAREQVRQQEQGLTQAQQQLASARQTLTAAQIGYTDAVNQRLRAETAQADVEAAERAVESAQIAYEQAQAGEITLRVDQKEIDRAMANVKAATSLVALYSAQRSKRILTSPVSGVISARHYDVGEIPTMGAAVFTVVTTDSLEFSATVSELDVTRVSQGAEVDVTVDGVPDEAIVGRVISVLPAGDVASRSFTVKVAIPAESGVKPGMFARGEIVLRESPDAVVVPKDVLIEQEGAFVAYVVENGAAVRRSVLTGIVTTEQVEVLEGIADGEQVVLSGKENLSDGAAVQVTNEGDLSAPAEGLASAAPEATLRDPEAESREAAESAPSGS